MMSVMYLLFDLEYCMISMLCILGLQFWRLGLDGSV